MHRRARLGCLLVGLAAVGCKQSDPYVHPGLWRPTEANDTNLRAMLANPADLYGGHGAALSSGDVAATAVARLRSGADRPLADTSISSVQVSGAGAAPTGPAGPGNAADPVNPGGSGPTAGDGP